MSSESTAVFFFLCCFVLGWRSYLDRRLLTDTGAALTEAVDKVKEWHDLYRILDDASALLIEDNKAALALLRRVHSEIDTTVDLPEALGLMTDVFDFIRDSPFDTTAEGTEEAQ